MKRIFWLLPIGLALAVYLPALWGERVWDDQTALGQQLAAFKGIGDILWPPAGIPDWTYSYYRPLVTLSYLLDSWLAGPAATIVPHAANIVYHAVATGLLWMLAARLFARTPAGSGAALLAAAVFAVHPIHTEAVSWITGRSDVLATLFLLAALLLALRWRDRRSPWALCLTPALVLLALLAKETGVVALLLIPLLLLVVPSEAEAGSGKRSGIITGLAIVLACLGAVSLYLWLRHAAAVQAGASPGAGPADFLGRLAAAAAWYLRKAFIPWPQCSLVSWAMVSGSTVTALILLSGAALTAWSIAAYRRARDPAPILATCWFWIAIAVPLWSGVGMVSRTPLAERHLYLPSVGIALGLAALWRWASAGGRRAPANAIAIAIIAAYAIGTVQRGFVWQTDLALWTNVAGQVRNRGLPWLNLGMARWRSGDTAGALASFRQAAQSGDEAQFRARAYVGMGTIFARTRDLTQAESHFRTAIALGPESPEPYYGLACVYVARTRALSAAGDSAARQEAADLAIHFLRRALDRNVRYYPARLELSGFLAQQAEWLDLHGEHARATELYGVALGELEALVAALPVEQREQALTVLRSEVGFDADALRGSIERHIAQQP